MKPNWPLIAILSGAAVTLVIVLLIVFSPPTYTGPEVATVDAVELSDAEAEPVSGTISVADGCFYVSHGTSSKNAYAIWPAGFVRDDNTVVAPDGRVFAEGDTISSNATTVDRAEAVGSSDYLNRLTGSCMGADSNGEVLLLFSID